MVLFWDKKAGKKQGGHRDIDLLAVGCDSTEIVSVVSNLDDKVGFDREGNIRSEQLDKLHGYFDKTKKYLANVKEYKWLVKKRKTKYVLAYLNHSKKKHEKLELELKKKKIELLSGKKIVDGLRKYLSEAKNAKIQNQMLRMMQVMEIVGSRTGGENGEKHKA